MGTGFGEGRVELGLGEGGEQEEVAAMMRKTRTRDSKTASGQAVVTYGLCHAIYGH
jgi:hypothetical protein